MNYRLFLFLARCFTLFLYASGGLSYYLLSFIRDGNFFVFSYNGGYNLVGGVFGIYAYGSNYYFDGDLRVCVKYGEFLSYVGPRSDLATIRVKVTCGGLAIGSTQARGDQVRGVKSINYNGGSCALIDARAIRFGGRLIGDLLALVITTTGAYTSLTACNIGLVGGSSAE